MELVPFVRCRIRSQREAIMNTGTEDRSDGNGTSSVLRPTEQVSLLRTVAQFSALKTTGQYHTVVHVAIRDNCSLTTRIGRGENGSLCARTHPTRDELLPPDDRMGNNWTTSGRVTPCPTSTCDKRIIPLAMIDIISPCHTTTYGIMTGRETCENAALLTGRIRA